MSSPLAAAAFWRLTFPLLTWSDNLKHEHSNSRNTKFSNYWRIVRLHIYFITILANNKKQKCATTNWRSAENVPAISCLGRPFTKFEKEMQPSSSASMYIFSRILSPYKWMSKCGRASCLRVFQKESSRNHNTSIVRCIHGKKCMNQIHRSYLLFQCAFNSLLPRGNPCSQLCLLLCFCNVS